MNTEIDSDKPENTYICIKIEPVDEPSEPEEISDHSTSPDGGFGYTVPIEYSKTSCVKNEPPDDPEESVGPQRQVLSETKNGEVWIPVPSSTLDVVIKCESTDDHSISDRSVTVASIQPVKQETNPEYKSQKKVDETSWSSNNQESRYEKTSTPSLNDHSDLIITTTLDDGKVRKPSRVIYVMRNSVVDMN